MVLSFREFSKPLRMFILTKAFKYIQAAFINFLINIYLWRIAESISFLVLYNVLYQLAHALAYVPSGKINKEWNRFIPLRAGPTLNMLFLLLILLLKERIVDFVVPVALIGGISSGLYWSSDNLLKFDLTRTSNRLRFTAIHQTLKYLSNGIVPLIASIIVVSGSVVFSAYDSVFTLAIVFSLLAVVSTFFISKEKTFQPTPYSLLKHARYLLRNRNVRLAMLGVFLNSIANVLPVLLGLLLFFSTGTELSIGSYQLLTVAVSALAMYTIGKHFSKKDYKALLIYGGLANFFLIFILLFRQDYTAVLIYGMLSSLFMVTDAPFNPLVLDAMASACKTQKECLQVRVEYITMTELFLGAGIITGFSVLLFIGQGSSMLAIGLVAVIFGLAKLASNVILAQITPRSTIDIDKLN